MQFMGFFHKIYKLDNSTHYFPERSGTINHEVQQSNAPFLSLDSVIFNTYCSVQAARNEANTP